MLTKKVRDSLRKKWDRIAATTTETEPMGVTRIATVKALGLDCSFDCSLCNKVENLRCQS